jgi:WD40 repeat protein
MKSNRSLCRYRYGNSIQAVLDREMGFGRFYISNLHLIPESFNYSPAAQEVHFNDYGDISAFDIDSYGCGLVGFTSGLLASLPNMDGADPSDICRLFNSSSKITKISIDVCKQNETRCITYLGYATLSGSILFSIDTGYHCNMFKIMLPNSSPAWTHSLEHETGRALIGSNGKFYETFVDNTIIDTISVPEKSDVLSQLIFNVNETYHGCRNGKIYHFDSRTPRKYPSFNFKTTGGPVSYLVKVGDSILSSTIGGKIQESDKRFPTKIKNILEVSNQTQPLNLMILNKGQFLSAGDDGYIRLWSLNSFQQLNQWKLERGQSPVLKKADNGFWAACGSVIKKWDRLNC